MSDDEQQLELVGTPVPFDADRQARDAAFIADPGRWPYWPILPMKRRVSRDGFETVDAGYCITPDYPTVIAKGMLTNQEVIAQLTAPGGYLGPRCRRYDSVDAMLADGWTVD